MRLGQVDITCWISGFLEITLQSCGLAGVFSMEPVVLRLQSVVEIFWPSYQLGLEPATHTSEALTERYLNGTR
jgi:hypothetical protein